MCEGKGQINFVQIYLFLGLSMVLNMTSLTLSVCYLCALTPTLSAVPIPLEGLTLTDSSSAEGGLCSELSWEGVLIFLFVSPDCGKVKAAEITPSALWPIPLSSPQYPIRTSSTIKLFLYVLGRLQHSRWSEAAHPHAVKCHSLPSIAHQ